MNIYKYLILVLLFAGCSKDSAEEQDSVAPSVVSVSPVDKATDVLLSSAITVTYDEAIHLVDGYQILVNGTSRTCAVNDKVLSVYVTLENSTAYSVSIPKTAISDAAGNLASAVSFSFTTVVAEETDPTVYEAEKASRSTSLVIEKYLSGFSGTGYVGKFESTNDKLTFNLTDFTAGAYDIYIAYHTADFGAKSCNVSINGNAGVCDLPVTAGIFKETKVAAKKLLAGNNTIVLSAVLTQFYVDYIRVVPNTEPEVPSTISTTLVTPSPSLEAVKVYSFLLENYRKNIISSSMANVAWNINEAEWVKQHTGKYPAMATFDYIHLKASPANWIDYSKIEVLENWWNQNGLISANWHWIVPKSESLANSVDYEKDYTYEPGKTTFRAVNALKDGTWENKILKADLEKMAGYLLLLKNKNIPVIWRPLHEAAGNIYEYNNGTAWFWWGNDGAETYVQLWRYMFDYFQAQGLNNLIWVWTTQTKDNAFYPGDAYVDIVGRDIYNNSTLTNLAAQFTSIQDAYPTKMVTLSECGNVAKISAQWAAGAEWSFFMPWYDYKRTLNPGTADFELTTHEHADKAWWVDAFAMDNVITLDEMPSLK